MPDWFDQFAPASPPAEDWFAQFAGKPMPSHAPPDPTTMTNERWATLSPREKAGNVLKWGGKVIAGMTGMGEPGRELIQSAEDNPALTMGSLALPSAVRRGGRAVAPYVAPGLRRIAQAAEHPVMGSALGGMEGARRGGVRGILPGAATGLVLSTGTSRLLKSLAGLAERATPRTNPGGRLLPRRQSGAERLTQMLTEGERPTSVQLQPSHPPGGGFTVPGPVNPNATGRLGGPATPTRPIEATALEAALREAQTPQAMNLGLSHPSGGGFTVPPTVPQSGRPLVTYSPRAQQVLKTLSRRNDPMPALESNEIAALTKRYRELSRKLILTPDETRELAVLQPRIKGSAREVGLTYPAGGSPRNAQRNIRTGEVMLNAAPNRAALLRLMASHRQQAPK